MIEIKNYSTDPFFNLALEEYVTTSMRGDVFILWQNRPAVIIGRHQNTIEEVNQDFLRQKGIDVVRRISGGGAVYHDLGNLNFTFVETNENYHSFDFEKFTWPVIKALDRIGIKAENNGRNDITIAGKKFSGNAQFKYHNRIMHHGTLLFDSDVETMVGALNVSQEKITSKGVKSVKSRVTNIKNHLSSPLTIEDFRRILTQTIIMQADNYQEYELSALELEAVMKLREDKYLTWEWTFGASPGFNIEKKGRFKWGTMDIRLEVKKGIINQCRIYGDFFSIADITELENLLVGIPYQWEAINGIFRRINLADFLPHAQEADLMKLLSS